MKINPMSFLSPVLKGRRLEYVQYCAKANSDWETSANKRGGTFCETTCFSLRQVVTGSADTKTHIHGKRVAGAGGAKLQGSTLAALLHQSDVSNTTALHIGGQIASV